MLNEAQTRKLKANTLQPVNVVICIFSFDRAFVYVHSAASAVKPDAGTQQYQLSRTMLLDAY